MTETDTIPPSDFTCPLTLEIFNDPLVSKHGHSFERQAILEWLAEGNNTCPITRKPLSPSMLFPHVALRQRVKAWERSNNSSNQASSDSEESSSGSDAEDNSDYCGPFLCGSLATSTPRTSSSGRNRSSSSSRRRSNGERRGSNDRSSNTNISSNNSNHRRHRARLPIISLRA